MTASYHLGRVLGVKCCVCCINGPAVRARYCARSSGGASEPVLVICSATDDCAPAASTVLILPRCLIAPRRLAKHIPLKKFESRLQRYQAFMANWQHTPAVERTMVAQAEHDQLEAEAAQALWYLVIQREALGLRSHTNLFELYAVRANVRRRMGPIRSVTPPPQADRG